MDGSAVAAPAQTLSLMLDNNLPEVKVVDILHNGVSVPPCTILNLGNNDGVQIKITAKDAEGNLQAFTLSAYYGAGQSVQIYSDSYASHVNAATHKWVGETEKIVPAAKWVPPITCAYQFRLGATAKVSNGYYYIGYAEDSRHITLIKTAPLALKLTPKISEQFPIGFGADGKPAAAGKEPEKLGKDSI